jgi:short-subunit dehydrogenase
VQKNLAKSATRTSSALLPHLAVVTGAGSGIGRAIALELARRGVACCLVSRNMSRLQNVVQLTNQLGVESIPIAVDLCDPDTPAVVDRKIRALGCKVGLLVHSAGMIRYSQVADSHIGELSDLVAVNLLAPFALTKLLLADICETRGQIVFINSSVVHHPAPGTALYAATKHALKGFADGLRQELNARGVRVISIYPGRTATPLQESLCKIQGRAYLPKELLQPADVASVVVHALALPHSAEVTDLMIRPAVKPSN